MIIPTVKDCILPKDERKVRFIHYRAYELWYVCDNGFQFPVPISDIGDATFLAEDRASFFMRYIRLHIEMLSKETE